MRAHVRQTRRALQYRARRKCLLRVSLDGAVGRGRCDWCLLGLRGDGGVLGAWCLVRGCAPSQLSRRTHDGTVYCTVYCVLCAATCWCRSASATRHTWAQIYVSAGARCRRCGLRLRALALAAGENVAALPRCLIGVTLP